jgi:transmembrane sensor
MADPSDTPSDPPSDWQTLRAEAADWLTRLRDTGFDPHEPYTDLTQRGEAFLCWVRQSRRHYGAFLQIAGTDERVAAIDAAREKDVAALLARAREEFADDRRRLNESVARRPLWSADEPSRLPLRGTRYSRPFPVYRVAAAVVVLAVAAYFASIYLDLPPPLRVFSTKVGKVQKFTLTDGTRLTLDTNSRVEVRYTRGARRVDVIQGGAAFVVAHDTSRPFMTCVGGILLKDLGTEFAVEPSARGARVTVASGSVDVAGPCSPRDSSQDVTVVHSVLRGGEHADIDLPGSGRLEIRTQARTHHQMDVALSWQRGLLIFEGVPLVEAIQQINRYLPRKLVLGEPALNRIPYGGTVQLSVLESRILRNLKDAYSIVPDPKRTTPTEVVLVPAPGHSFGGPY